MRKYGIETRIMSEVRKLVFKINIPKKELKKLYLEKKLSSLKIAKIYGCGQVTVRNRLRKYRIPIRTLSETTKLHFNINISKRELKDLYLKRGFSSPELAQIYYCRDGLY
jgi:hypothetical protein